MRHERGDVALAGPERRQRERHHVEPIVEVVAERPGADLPGEQSRCVPATTRTSTWMVSRPPTRSSSPCCSTRRSFTWSEEGGARPRRGTGCRRPPPRAVPTANLGVAEGARLVTEQLGLEQPLRARRAVDADERPTAAGRPSWSASLPAPSRRRPRPARARSPSSAPRGGAPRGGCGHRARSRRWPPARGPAREAWPGRS